MRKYNNGDACPLCDEGALKAKEVDKVVNYRGERLTMPGYPVYYCGHCGEGFVDEETSDRFEKTVRDSHRKVDGLLTSDEIRAIRKKAGLTQDGFAKLLDITRVSVTRYEKGRQTQSMEIDRKIRELEKNASAIQIPFAYEFAEKRTTTVYRQAPYCKKKDCSGVTMGKGNDYALAA